MFHFTLSLIRFELGDSFKMISASRYSFILGLFSLISKDNLISKFERYFNFIIWVELSVCLFLLLSFFKQCPWATPQNTISSLADVMSEQLAKELQLEEEAATFPEVV